MAFFYTNNETSEKKAKMYSIHKSIKNNKIGINLMTGRKINLTKEVKGLYSKNYFVGKKIEDTVEKILCS